MLTSSVKERSIKHIDEAEDKRTPLGGGGGGGGGDFSDSGDEDEGHGGHHALPGGGGAIQRPPPHRHLPERTCASVPCTRTRRERRGRRIPGMGKHGETNDVWCDGEIKKKCS